MEASIFVVRKEWDVFVYAYEKKVNDDSDGSQFILVKDIHVESTEFDRGNGLLQWMTTYLTNHATDSSHIELKIVSNCDLGGFPPVEAFSDVSVISVLQFNNWQSEHHFCESDYSAVFRIHGSHGIIHYGGIHMKSTDEQCDFSHLSLWVDVGSGNRIEVLSTNDPLISTSVYVPVWSNKNLLRLQFYCFQEGLYSLIGRIEYDFDQKSQIIIAIHSLNKNQEQQVQIKIHHMDSHRSDCFLYDENSDRIVKEDGRHPVLLINHSIDEDDCVFADIDLHPTGTATVGQETVSVLHPLNQSVSKHDLTGKLYNENWLISRYRNRGWYDCPSDHDEWFIGELSEKGERIKGTVLTSQGDIMYEGEWSGQGTLYHIPSLPNCSISGHFENGIIYGEATIVNTLTMSIVFQGKIKDVASGRAYGTTFFNSIPTYKGDLVNWKPEGEGQLYSMNGLKWYEGLFVAGYPEGKGKQYYYDIHLPMTIQGTTERKESSVLYEGDFLKGMKNGEGKLMNKKQEIVYYGDWKENQIDGRGKMWLVNTEEECREYVSKSCDALMTANQMYVEGWFEKGQVKVYKVDTSLWV